MYALQEKEIKKKCVLCSGPHWESRCEKFKTKDQRAEKCHELGICFKCLEFGHLSKNCKAKVNCFFCKKAGHNTAFCQKIPKNNIQKNVTNQLSQIATKFDEILF